jgi:hypothetical protein
MAVSSTAMTRKRRGSNARAFGIICVNLRHLRIDSFLRLSSLCLAPQYSLTLNRPAVHWRYEIDFSS